MASEVQPCFGERLLRAREHCGEDLGQLLDRQELDRLLQAYAVERAKIEARKKGHRVTEQALPDGSIKLTVNVGGAA